MPPLSAADAPSLSLQAPDGASARVYLDGAHVTSWIPAGGEERLYLSARAWFGPGYAIRGGIPLCWPQFGASGPLRQHGFARLMRWRVVREEIVAGTARAVLALSDTDASRAQWPFAFHAELAVAVHGATLAVELTVSNTDGQPFSFTAALHPYFLMQDAFAASVIGLQRTTYRDALQEGAILPEHGPSLEIRGPLDRVYFDTPDALEIREPHRSLHLRKRGFADAVVWNPGAEGTASREDFVAGDEHRMLCVEAAAVGRAITLAPGERWSGVQEMIAG